MDDVCRPLMPYIIRFLNIEDNTVRKSALSAVNTAAFNKPGLIRGELIELIHGVCENTTIRKEFIHQVKMGPFTHTTDTGYETRKAAFETLHTLLQEFNNLGEAMTEIVTAVLNGLSDEHNIQFLANEMLIQISQAYANETFKFIFVEKSNTSDTKQTSVSDESDSIILTSYKKIFSQRLKEAPTRREAERRSEIFSSCFKTAYVLITVFDLDIQRISDSLPSLHHAYKFSQFIDENSRKYPEFSSEAKKYITENKIIRDHRFASTKVGSVHGKDADGVMILD